MNNNEILLKQILEKLENIDTRLVRVESLLQGPIQNNTEKMKQHIDFIEDVYENVRNPLGIICNKINSLVYTQPNNEKKLPSIQNNN